MAIGRQDSDPNHPYLHAPRRRHLLAINSGATQTIEALLINPDTQFALGEDFVGAAAGSDA
jgi:hypothetical protein